MKNVTTILGAILFLEAICVLPAQARTSHRPWLARQPKPVSSPAAKVERGVSVNTVMNSPGARIAQQAAGYKGTRYRFGGTSKRGVDCSGLVQRVYNDLNLRKVPRTAGSLYKMGNAVHLNELKPGDLVFFKNTYKRGVSHVGVYAGDNRFVHAQNRRHGVTVTSLADPYYQLHYAGARRLY